MLDDAQQPPKEPETTQQPTESPLNPTAEPTLESVVEPPPAPPEETETPAEPEPMPEIASEQPAEPEEPQTEIPAEVSAEVRETIHSEEVSSTPPLETAQRENEPFIEAKPGPPQEQPEAVPEAEAPAEPAPAPIESIPAPEPASAQSSSEAQPATVPPPAQTSPPPPQPAPQPPTPPFANFATRAREMLIKARTAIQDRKRKKLDKILVLLDEKKNIGNDDVEKLLHVSDATATRYLNQLEKETLIKQVGTVGKDVFYEKLN